LGITAIMAGAFKALKTPMASTHVKMAAVDGWARRRQEGQHQRAGELPELHHHDHPATVEASASTPPTVDSNRIGPSWAKPNNPT